MAVDLHTRVDTSSLPYQFLPEKLGEEDVTVTSTLPPSRDHNHSNINHSSALEKPQVLIPHEFGSNTTSPLPRLAHSMLQDDDKFDFSGIGSLNMEPSWDSMGSPQSTLWSTLGSSLGSPEGSSREPSPGNSHDSCRETTYDVVGMLEKMRLDDERDNSKYHHHAHGTHNLNTSDVGTFSRQSLIQEQIRAIQLSRLKQEQILSLKQKQAAYRESESNEQIVQFQNKGFGRVGFGVGRKTCLTRPAPIHQQPGSEMQELFLGGSHSRGTSCGTGVFLPRGRTSAPCQSRKKPDKGCSTILIPARVVQALQLHFDQMAATSGPKASGFPPLHDVLVSNRDGMYSLQKRQSRKAPPNMHNEMILPQEWTY